MITQAYNFEPFVQLVKATACGSQITKQEREAYDYACDYYGEERVALQETLNSVDCFGGYSKDQRIIDIGPHIVQMHPDNSLLTFVSIQRMAVEKHAHSPYSLFIHWPKAIIANENDQSVEIKDLFARIPLSSAGMNFNEHEPFTFMRTTFSRVQWNHTYIHSHVQELVSPMKFRHVCLGTGPIKNTIHTLKCNPANKEAMMLFFWELDKVVHVESLAGVPYIRMSSLRNNTPERVYTVGQTPDCLIDLKRQRSKGPATKDFLASFFRTEDIPFAFRDGKYILGCSFLDFAVKISNYYLKWKDALNYAKRIEAKVPEYVVELRFIMGTYIIKDGRLYKKGIESRNKPIPTNVSPFLFNGKEFPLIVEEESKEKDYMECKLIPLHFILSVINYMLASINAATSLAYEEKQKKESDFWSEQFNLSISAPHSNTGEYGRATSSTTTCD